MLRQVRTFCYEKSTFRSVESQSICGQVCVRASAGRVEPGNQSECFAGGGLGAGLSYFPPLSILSPSLPLGSIL